ncbi:MULTISPECIES: hypothetical protein [unclassified Schlesneria]|uniref:hypothetical protein n=1 Tax=Schlesneria TaxID=656899 RepID=UPI0035A0B655
MIFAAGNNIDISQIIGMCVLVISFLSWFVNLFPGKNQQKEQLPKAPRPQQRTAQNEIEVLLQQLTGEKPKSKPPRREQPQASQAPKPPKPPRDRSKNGQRSTNQRNVSQAQPNPKGIPTLSSEISQGSSGFGLATSAAGIGGHPHQLGGRVDAAVNRDINSAVQHDLGNQISEAQPRQAPQLHPLVKVLRDPIGIRQAVLLNEILQRPKGLKR